MLEGEEMNDNHLERLRKLIQAADATVTSLSQSDTPPPIVVRDVRERLQQALLEVKGEHTDWFYSMKDS